MQIDWLTVAAQIVNFLILVWLLKRFLYGPIVRAMERREARIAERLREAERQCAAAELEAQSFRDRQHELEARRAELLARAGAEAEAERQALRQAARDEVAERKAEWLKQVEAERAEFLQELRERAAAQFNALARRALCDLADAQLEDQVASVFIAKLAGLPAESKRALGDAARQSGAALRILSGFELPPATRRRLIAATHEHVLDGVDVAYETTPRIACGLELRAGPRTVSWSIDSYLDGLESRLAADMGRVAPLSAP